MWSPICKNIEIQYDRNSKGIALNRKFSVSKVNKGKKNASKFQTVSQILESLE